MVSTSFRFRLVLLSGLLALWACDSGTEPALEELIKESGDEQVGAPGEELGDPLVVRAVNGEGQGIPNVEIVWTVEAGGGSVSPETSVTDEEGRAEARWTLGTDEAESQRLSARAAELSPVEFSARFPTGDDFSQVGNLVTLNTETSSACQNPDERTGRVEAIGEHVIVVADTANPEPTFSRTDYEEFAAAYDSRVRPLTDDLFGAPEPVGGESRVVAFFTKAVNELTEADSDQVVLGFFFARDLFPREGTAQLQGCPASNELNMFYMRVPDEDGEVGSQQDREAVRRFTVSTMAHEHQHLVNANRRLFVQQVSGSQPFEALWLNEGLSHLTEEIFFFQEAGLSSRTNIGGDELTGAGEDALDAFNEIQIINLVRIAEFMQDPSESSVVDDEDGSAMRGGAWHFLRYALDRDGGSEHARVDALVNTTRRGISNLEAVLGIDAHDWMADWAVTLYTDGRVDGVSEEFTDRSWNHADLFARLQSGGEPIFEEFPIETHELADGAEESVTVRGGGAVYLRFGVEAGEEGEVTVNGGNGCGGGNAHSLASVGDALQLEGSDAEGVCLDGGSEGAEYVAVGFHGADPDEDLSLTFEASGTRGVDGPPLPAVAQPAPSPVHTPAAGHFGHGPAPRVDHDLHMELMRRAERELGPLVRGGGGALRGPPPAMGSSGNSLPGGFTLTVVRTQ